jgi:hypothetical protein
LYKVVIIIYFICFLCYVLFSRVPDYFEGDYTKGVVSKATFSVKDKHPVVIVNYRVGKEELQYTSYMWFLTSYKPGQVIRIIYDPSNPRVASIYSFTGYWVRWPELLITAIVFIVLFIAAVYITGKNNTSSPTAKENNRKRRYDE